MTIQEAQATSLNLPPEVWLEILSRCSYFDLKRAQRVSRAFHDLTQNPALDGLLYRAPPRLSLLPTTMRPSPHPIFGLVNLVASDVADIRVCEGGQGAIELDVCEEMATCPSSSRLVLIGLGHGGQITNLDGKGVTVGQVIHRVVEIWNEPHYQAEDPVDDYLRSHACRSSSPNSDDEEEDGDSDLSDDGMNPSCISQLFETSDHVYFSGWDSCTVDNTGGVVLQVDSIGI